jgi:hypothetical protein
MRWANCFTASEVPRSLASRPSSTSALPPLAAFVMNFWSAAAILVATAPPLEVSEREVWALPYSGRPRPISGECPHYKRSHRYLLPLSPSFRSTRTNEDVD